MDSMSRGDGLNFSDALWGDEHSTLRERLKATLQSKSHALEKTSVDHIGERMAIQNSKKIGCETQPACDLSQTSEEDRGADQPRGGGGVFGVARIANESMWPNAVQEERRTPETPGSGHRVGPRRGCAGVRPE